MIENLKEKLTDKTDNTKPEIEVTFSDQRILLKDFIIESTLNNDKYIEVQRFQVKIIKQI